MKGYLVKYSTGSYDDYRERDVKVYLDLKQAERYVEKFNRIISKAKEFYKSKYKDTYDISIEEYDIREEYWDDMYDKFELYGYILEAWVEEIEIVETKADKSRWD